jgi:hypothetical protein
MLGIPEFYVLLIDEEVHRRGGLSGDDDGVEARTLQLEREVAGGERVSDETGERGFGDHAKFGRRGEASADQRGTGEDQGITGTERIDCRR